ncbi:cytochrome P450 4C1-like [Chironomus tepperi]|uniref:cytochrome P450 4C1-like n=1 Tax=Chironomus tepperi TaxID=113505 RepID=UPI00391F5047
MYELADKIPGTNGWPIVGHMFSYLGLDLENNLNDGMRLIKSNLPVSKIWAGSSLFIIVNSAEHSQTLLNSSDCLDIPFMFGRPFLHRYSLVTANGDIWQKHRKILSYSFKLNVLNSLQPLFNEKIKKCIDKLQSKVDSGNFNISEFIAALTLETTMKGNFNYDEDFYGHKLIDDIDNAKLLLMKRLSQPWMNFEFLFKRSQLYRDMLAQFTEYHQKIDEIIEDNEIRNKSNGGEPLTNYVIDQLLNKKYNLSHREIRDEIYIFIMAGYETSSLSLSTIILLLAIHTDVQQKLINEVDEFFDGTDVSVEDLHKYKYVEMVIKESLRIYPTIPLVPREVTKEFQMNEHRIPKDAILVELIYEIHRNKDYWGEDALKFRPERFEPENMKNVHTHAFIPFAAGRRMCIGHKYAMMFAKTFLVHFFNNYELTSPLKFEELTPKMTPTLDIAQKYIVSLKRRNKNV